MPFDSFVNHHNGPCESDIKQMLQTVGVASLEELINKTVPENIRLKEPPDLDVPVSEYEYLGKVKNIAAKNKIFRSFIGMGWYGTAILPVVLRNIFENPSWYTSYTPYQAEISQGRLEALLNFQTMVSSLTGFAIANCSLLDEATATAEAMRMMFELRSREAVKAGKNILFVDENIFPQTCDVLLTRAAPLGIKITKGKFDNYTFEDNCFGAILQYPAANGAICNYTTFCSKAHEKQILVAAICDILSLALLKEPAAWGADMAVGSTQRLGIPMGFGGPAAAYFATKDQYKRNMPGRIIGLSVDRLGNPALRMALQTREQHIKREKATSNICTATALSAIMAGMFAVYHGPEGLKRIASHAHKYAVIIAEKLKAAGYKLASEHFFDTIEIQEIDAKTIRAKATAKEINFFYPSNNSVRISFDEVTTCQEAKAIMEIFDLKENCTCENFSDNLLLPRETEILTEKIFCTCRSETEMMRYIKKLERRDISLTQSMIPLGSCTMKLNAAIEMLPLSWPEFYNIHPYAPADQTEGYLQMIKELEHDLAVITGFDAVSLQPNSGAAGEYTGLMTIRAYHQSKGDKHRNVALIPVSAHGTNPASAIMAGMHIVTVNCDENGNINIDELREKATLYKDTLSCFMITYPSTHGVFESRVKEMVQIIHENGGLVFMDGANMNAQAGLTNPGFIGADVCHLNLHKTFAMPHGGGGPGVGPVAVAKHLTPFLPSHCALKTANEKGISAVSSAPYGNAMLCFVTHAYIKLLGAEGLKQATSLAILNANYLSARLRPHYNTLYTGETGYVAHECIIDLRHFKKEYGVDATDVAKRLMDFGFHAPTLSFPVPETLMIEPTESESLAEIERFVQALIAIKEECTAIGEGKYDPHDNLLKMSPHTAGEIAAGEWKHSYSRMQAAYPLAWVTENKFWPYVARVDNGYGDRNLITTAI